jgi:hypothetical protein
MLLVVTASIIVTTAATGLNKEFMPAFLIAFHLAWLGLVCAFLQALCW